MENGDQFWRNEDGKLHRVDGPAREWANGDREWWVQGVQLSKQEFTNFLVQHRLKIQLLNFLPSGSESLVDKYSL